LLWRFYNLIDEERHRKVLEDPIISVLESMAGLENIKKHRPAAVMYFYLINAG
jgi:hypothetical protein